MQASQATFQEGAFKPKQQDKRNELSIQTAGKKETSSRDTTEIKDDINKAFQCVLDDHIKSDAGPLQKGGEQNCITLYFVPVRIQGNSPNLFVIEIEVARDWRFCNDKVYYSKE